MRSSVRSRLAPPNSDSMFSIVSTESHLVCTIFVQPRVFSRNSISPKRSKKMFSAPPRHSQKCPHQNDIAWRRCRCPKWIQGTPSEDHEFLRTSAQTRTWEQAEAKARQLEEAARPGARKPAPAISIAEAVAAYRADEAGRC